MKFEHDCEHENGKRFVLMQLAYLDGPADSRGYYVADAFCPDDEADMDLFQYTKYTLISSTTTTLSAVTRTAPAIGGQSQTTEYVIPCMRSARRTTRITAVGHHRFRSVCIIKEGIENGKV